MIKLNYEYRYKNFILNKYNYGKTCTYNQVYIFNYYKS